MKATSARAADTSPANPFLRQPQIGVIRPQTEPELRARGKHPIGFGDPLSGKIVHHDPEVRFRPVEPYRGLAASRSSGIDPREQALCAALPRIRSCR